MLNFCPKCGNRLQGDRFCPNCGADLSAYLSADSGQPIQQKQAQKNSVNMNDLAYLAKKAAEEKRAQEEAARRAREAEEARIVEAARKAREAEEARKRAEAEEARKRAEIEAARKSREAQIKEIYDISDGRLNYCKKTDILRAEIPYGVKEIGYDAFRRCTSLKEVIIPGSVEEIKYGFEGCKSIESVIIQYGVKTISYEAFKNCSNLEKVTIPGSVTEISANAFEGCSYLSSVLMSNGLETIGLEAFKDCRSLRRVTIPRSVRSIGTHAFKGCSLSQVTIPTGCKVGWYAFSTFCEVNIT